MKGDCFKGECEREEAEARFVGGGGGGVLSVAL